MAQPVGFPGGGLRLGKNATILAGVGDPNVSSAADVKAARLNYLFIREDAPDGNNWLYRCSASAIFSNGALTSSATWTAK